MNSGSCCFACGGLIMEPGKSSGWGCKVCLCPKEKPIQPNYSVSMPVHVADTYLNVRLQKDEDVDRRETIAVKAMVAIESANFENAHQASITVEDVADRAVRMADALIARLKV